MDENIKLDENFQMDEKWIPIVFMDPQYMVISVY
jgi:hypothetical protein